MRLLTEDAVLLCDHTGRCHNQPSQSFVRIERARILVDSDPEGRSISGCPNYGPTIKPCTTALQVLSGYSDWVRIGGKRVCTEQIIGVTDGTPPTAVRYRVKEPGQSWVDQR